MPPPVRPRDLPVVIVVDSVSVATALRNVIKSMNMNMSIIHIHDMYTIRSISESTYYDCPKIYYI